MQKFIIKLVAPFVLVISILTTANAATRLTPVSGQTLVNHGAGFVVRTETVSLKAGDRIMVSPGSRAFLSYGNNCGIPLTAGIIITISNKSPCTFKANSDNSSNLEPAVIGILSAAFLGFIIYDGLKNDASP